MFSVSTVLGEKASDVEKSWGAGAKLAESRPPLHWIGRGQLNEGIMFGELRCFFRDFILFFSFLFCFGGVWMAGWEWMCEWMSSECHFCVQTLDRGERCLGPDLQCPWSRHHQAPHVGVTRSQPSELLKPDRKGLLLGLLERALLSGNVGVCVEHFYKKFLSVLS